MNKVFETILPDVMTVVKVKEHVSFYLKKNRPIKRKKEKQSPEKKWTTLLKTVREKQRTLPSKNPIKLGKTQ